MNTPQDLPADPGQSAVRRFPISGSIAVAFLIAATCAVLFAQAFSTVSRVHWTDNFDSLRDVGMAHSILSGRYPEDPIYAGETLWYNPLIAACVACVARITGLDPVDADVRLGPVINLLVPAAFTALMLYWFDPWIALVAAAYLLFGRPPLKPVWMTTTYSPILLAGNFTQALFFLTLLAYTRFVRKGGTCSRVATGVLWGLTFIGHTAPAVILGITLTIAELFRWKTLSHQRGFRAALTGAKEYAAILAIAFVCSLPYTYSILWHYHFHIVNEWPTRYADPYIAPERLPAFIGECLTPSTAFAAIGLITASIAFRRRTEDRLVILWWLTAIGFLSYSFLSQSIDRKWHFMMPQIVPGHHAMLFLSSAKALLFGLGTLGLLRWMTAPIANRMSDGARRYIRIAADVLAALIAAATLIAFHRDPTELSIARNAETFNKANEDTRSAYDWIVANTTPDDVFLCEWDLAGRLMDGTGRKLVASMIWYSNPYVDFQRRCTAKNDLFDALKNRDEKAFRDVAAVWNVRYILLQKQQNLSDPNGHEIAAEALDTMALPFIERVFTSGRYSIYRTRPAAANQN